MPEEKDNTNNVNEESVSTIQDETLNVEISAGATDPRSVLKAKVEKKESFTERMKTHRFLLVRGIYYIFYSIWAIVMGIGMVIAWLIAMLFI